MARQPGTKTVAFSEQDMAEMGLYPSDDFAEQVKAKLRGGLKIDGDLTDFLEARANGLGCTQSDVMNQLLRMSMMELLMASAATEEAA